MKAFIYTRMEDEDTYRFLQAERRSKTYFDDSLALHGYSFGGFFRDDCITATTLLAQRPGGSRMMAEAKRGDLVVLANLVQTWSSMRDMASTLALWKMRGVSCYLLHLELLISNEEPGARDFLEAIVDLENTMDEWKVPEQPEKETFYKLVNDLKDRGFSSTQIAEKLHKQGHRTAYGKPWDGGSLRAWMCRYRKERRNVPESLSCSPESENQHAH